MANQIRLKRASGSDPGASDLVLGEPAVRTDTGEIFLKKDDGSIAKVAGGIDDGDKGDITVSNDGGTFTIDSGVVTSAKIANNTIVNGDINSSAAIAGSKISPDFGSQNIVTTGFITSNDITISDTSPTLNFTDTNHNSDFKITTDGGLFKVIDSTNTADRIAVHSDGEVDLYGHVDIGAGLDVTGAITSTGNLTISNTHPQIFFTDTDNNSDFKIQNLNGVFGVRDETNSATRFSIASNGTVNVADNLDVGAGLDVTGDVTVTSTAPKIDLVDSNANSDFRLKCDGGNFHIEDITNAGNRLSIDSSGDVIIHNDLDFPDNSKIKLGAGDDLQIFHDGSHSRINNSTGYITSNSAFGHILRNSDGSETLLKADVNAAVELYYNNTKRIETTDTGATITGNLTSTASSTFGLLGAAYSTNYFGLKTSSQTLSSEYMIISANTATYISASSGHPVYIRYGANDSTNQLTIGSGNDALTWRGNKVFHAGNDGAGSGLDADSVDGIAGSSFLRSDATDSASGALTFTGGLTTNLTSISNGILELKAAIATSHTITTDYNALAVDPTINNGVTVTVPSGAVWAIV